jgi:glucose-6-phosphate isomerase
LGKLQNHYLEIKTFLQEMFAKDTNRAEKFHINWNNFLVDYSKNIISEETQNYY